MTSAAPASVRVIVLMGVAGSGKTTVGARLARELGWPFRDADAFHPAANVAKMTADIPLDDADRAPWLAAIRAYIEERLARGERAVVTCSALKQRYRETIQADAKRVKLVFLHGDYSLLAGRLRQRPGHFMKESMLKSQFEILEEPTDALRVDASASPKAIVSRIRKALGV